MENFIGMYDNVVSESDCKWIIEWFENSSHLHSSGTFAEGKTDLSVKHSTDIHLRFESSSPPSKIIFSSLNECAIKYINHYRMSSLVQTFGSEDIYNIQRYAPNEGYFAEHCEHDGAKSSRILAWTLYLNDVGDGGETLYTLYDYKVKAISWRMVIFPAYWTHAHRGIISKTETKYIATGWFSLT